MDGAEVAVEPFIEGSYAKFNSNSGWVNEDCEHRLMQALSHFSYHHTGGQRLLCDLQGGAYDTHFVLTDPAILSTNRAFGQADGGTKFMQNFFGHHKCNCYCDRGWMRMPVSKPLFRAQRGTSFLPRALGKSTAFDT